MISTKDPMIGTIMRYVDHNTAWNILNAYKGYTMSMKAVVALVGQTLGDMDVEDDIIEGEGYDPILQSSPVDQNVNAIGNTDQQTLPSDMIIANNVVSNPDHGVLDVDLAVSDFEGDNVYLTGVPGDAADDNDNIGVAAIEEHAIITPRPPNTNIMDNMSIDDSSLGSFEQFNKPYVLENAQEMVKPRSAASIKKHARNNLFAPSGMEKKASTLPHNADLATYKLGSLHASRGTTPGSPNNIKGTIISRCGTAENPKLKLFPDVSQWNSDQLDPMDPLDKININGNTGEIANVNVFHSRPGSRGPEPSALGIKGWNANTPATRKMAGGFVVSVEEGRDVKYGSKREHKDIPREIYPTESIEEQRQQQQLMMYASQSMENMSSTDMIGYSDYVRDLDGAEGEIQSPLPKFSRSLTDSVPDEDPDTIKDSRILMDAIETEKIALGTIPRMQPERALSDNHLLELGTGKTSIDAIAAQMRWAKEKRQRQSAAMQPSPENEKPSTSNTIGELNALTSNMPTVGGVGIQMNQFTNMDVALGFKPDGNAAECEPNRTLSRTASAAMMNAAGIKVDSTESMFSLENPNELKRLADANTKAAPRQLKSLARPILPVSPFKTYEERTKVTQQGVAAGMGLSIVLTGEMRNAKIRSWGARVKTSEGRYRTGRTSEFASGASEGLLSPNKESIEKRRRTGTMALP